MLCVVAVLSVLGLARAVDPGFDCTSGLPTNRAVDEASTGSRPYRVAVSDFPDAIAPGARRTVTIKGDQPFKGFFLRARYPEGSPIGEWELPGEGVSAATCGGTNDALYSNDGNYSSVSATWIAPDVLLNNNMEFVATVLQADGSDFWLDINTMLIQTSQSDVRVDHPVVDPAAGEEDQIPHVDPREVEPVRQPADDEDTAPVQIQPLPTGTGEDPLEPERLARDQHDAALRHDTQATPEDQAPPAVQPVDHDSRKEEEMEAAWRQKKAQMIDDEEANSEGAFNRVELLEQEAHEKEIHNELMAYEREQEEREKIRMERLRAEIRDKEEYDRQKAEEQQRLQQERERELELERERQRQLQQDEDLDAVISLGSNEEDKHTASDKVTASCARTTLSLAAMLTVVTAMLL